MYDCGKEAFSCMDNRLKASDVFQRTEYLLAEKSTFERAFPRIEDIRVTVEELEDYDTKIRDRYFNKSNAGEYINCSNRLCYGGGFRLGEIIRRMEESGEIERETSEYCHGYNGSPKGRKNYGPCEHRFNIKIKLQYKDEGN